MPHISIFKKRISDRSGFFYYEIGMVKDGPYKVGADEFDTPPPSKIPLGGEGDVSQGEMRSGADFSSISDTDTPTESLNPTVFVTAAGGITPNTHPFMLVTGSNTAVDISADPQIARGIQGQVLTLWCVDSGITLDNGTGLNMMASSRFVMTSGSVISFFFTTGATAAADVWNETSRDRRY